MSGPYDCLQCHGRGWMPVDEFDDTSGTATCRVCGGSGDLGQPMTPAQVPKPEGSDAERRARLVRMRNAHHQVNGYDYRPRAKEVVDGSGGSP